MNSNSNNNDEPPKPEASESDIDPRTPDQVRESLKELNEFLVYRLNGMKLRFAEDQKGTIPFIIQDTLRRTLDSARTEIDTLKANVDEVLKQYEKLHFTFDKLQKFVEERNLMEEFNNSQQSDESVSALCDHLSKSNMNDDGKKNA